MEEGLWIIPCVPFSCLPVAEHFVGFSVVTSLKSFLGPLTMSERRVFHICLYLVLITTRQSPGEGEAVEVEPFPDGVSSGLNRHSLVQRAALLLLSCVSRGCRSPSGLMAPKSVPELILRWLYCATAAFHTWYPFLV